MKSLALLILALGFARNSIGQNANVTDALGDKVTIQKISGAKVSINFRAGAPKGRQWTPTMFNTMTIGVGQIFCIMAANPTSTEVVEGSLGVIAPSSLVWQCSVGGQSVTSGTLSWP